MPGPTRPMAPLTEREVRMLLSLVEAERKNAELIEQKWRDTPEEGYPDGVQSLSDEQAFARGYACGVGSIENLISQVLNA